MGNPVVHFELWAKDAAPLHEFYGELFGWTVNTDNPFNYGLVDTQSDGKGVNGGIAQNEQGSGVIVYIEVDDVQAALDNIAAAGGKTVLPVTDIPGAARIAQFEDPAGNKVGLVWSQMPD